MGNKIIYNGEEYNGTIVNDSGVGEFYPKNTQKQTDASNNEIFNSYGGVGVNTIESVEENGVARNSTYGHAEGLNTHIYGADNAHVEGLNNQASGDNSHAEGNSNTVSGNDSHAEGNGNTVSGDRSHAEGYSCQATGEETHAEGDSCIASGSQSHAEGNGSKAIGTANHAEGWGTTASGSTGAHSEGYQTTASGNQSHAEGTATLASGDGTHAEGISTQATSSSAHAEGYETIASGFYTHAEGYMTVAAEAAGHAEGIKTQANGPYSHAEGQQTTASGDSAHAQNIGTIASEKAQTAIGKYNASNTKAALIIGNGNSTLQAISLYYSDFEYSIGEKVKLEVEKGIWKVYECIEAIPEPAGSFDVSKWNDITSNYTVDSEGNVSITTRSNALTVNWDGSIVAGQQAIISEHSANILAIGQNNTIGDGCDNSTVEGNSNTLDQGGQKCHIEGSNNTITAGSQISHIEGLNNTISMGTFQAHIEGNSNLITNGSNNSHAEGNNNTITNGTFQAHVEGSSNLIEKVANNSHAEGNNNIITDWSDTAPNYSFNAHVEGRDNISMGDASHTQGIGNRTRGTAQTALGMYNDYDTTATDTNLRGTYAIVVGNGSATPTQIPTYSNTNTYAVDEQVIFNDKAYKCITAVTVAEDFDSTKWEVLDIELINGNEITRSNAMTLTWDGILNVSGANADIRINGNSIATGGDIANPNISDAYNSSSTYNEGAYCIYNDILYKCNTAISVAEDFDSSKWTQTTIGAELLTIINRITNLEERLGNYSFADVMTQAEYDQITPEEDTVYPIVG